MKQVLILNGPNLNLLGKREPEIYGSQSFEAYFEILKKEFTTIDLQYFQSNIEGEIINKIHEVGFTYSAIILNAGAYTHTSLAIGDAVAAVPAKVIEVHISNVYKCEAYRHQSYIAPHTAGCIIGFGMEGYRLAVTSLL